MHDIKSDNLTFRLPYEIADERNVLRVCIKDKNGDNTADVLFFRYNYLAFLSLDYNNKLFDLLNVTHDYKLSWLGRSLS